MLVSKHTQVVKLLMLVSKHIQVVKTSDVSE